jgi:probable HAF family extracellular repeat protein
MTKRSIENHLVFVICSVALGASAQSFKVTDLGLLGKPEMGLNNNSEITGTTPDNRAFRWDNGVVTTLGTLGTTSFGRRINDAGHVAGYSYDGNSMRAVIFTGTNLTDLGALPSAVASYAVAINNSMQVAGFTVTGPGSYPYVATLWQGGNATNLGTLQGNWSRASDINNSGTIVGVSDNHAFIYNSVAGMQLIPDPPGFWAGTIVVEAINDSGVMVGSGSPTNYVQGRRALVWKQGSVLDIGLLIPPKNFAFSFASDINSNGEVVGDSDSPTGTHAFLYDSTNGMRDLNGMIVDTNWVLTSAVAVNDSGQIIGMGTYKGQTRSYLLTPTPILKMVVTGDQFGLTASKLAKNWPYAVQYSSDLSNWITLQTFMAPENQTNLLTSTVALSPANFYRLKF